MENKTYLCIDLKSFFASVECVERGLDPFKTNLVVADPSRGKGAICLAITPAMKALGIHNRCRIFEIPKGVEYIASLPHMKRYMEVSADIYSVYLNYVSPDDIHVYSIDECFLDVTQYLKMYRKTPKEMAVMLIDAVFEKTGICATAGIGTNLFLAKVALDITAKHAPDHIGYLNNEEFRRTIQTHQPITDIWNVGRGTAKRLEKYGVFDLKGVTELPQKLLYKEFGINAEHLINHANGIEPCTISEIKNYKPKSNSLSHGQILFEDYKYEDALLVLKEMVDKQVLELVEKKLVTDSISLYIGYSKDIVRATGGTRKIGEFTNSYKKLMGYFEALFKETTLKGYPIRKINIGFNNLQDDSMASITLFSDIEAEEKEKKLQEAIISIKNKHGKNAVLKGISYTEKGTARARNKLIGGHNGE
ncbi:MAG: DNA repair protein [Clostridia bacterium]|nr:DNA repair protein [Clostridia bacterium]